MDIPFNITVQELKQWKSEGKEFLLIDVREPGEYQTVNIGGELIPLNVLAEHLHELDTKSDIVVHCHMGGRSGMAVKFLRSNGFPRARNLHGGIAAWSQEADSGMKRISALRIPRLGIVIGHMISAAYRFFNFRNNK